MSKEEELIYVLGVKMGKYIPQLIRDDEIEVYLERLNESNKQLVKTVSALSQEVFLKKGKKFVI